ncbi:hypothetical protein BHE74_00001588, partial [Ensete ventricosum]
LQKWTRDFMMVVWFVVITEFCEAYKSFLQQLLRTRKFPAKFEFNAAQEISNLLMSFFKADL